MASSCTMAIQSMNSSPPSLWKSFKIIADLKMFFWRNKSKQDKDKDNKD